MNEKWNESIKKVTGLLLRYKYAMLVALLGLALMMLPFGASEDRKTAPESGPARQAEGSFEIERLEKRLSEMLSKCEGVGQAEVLLTQKSGMEAVYEKDRSQVIRNQSGETGNEYENEEQTQVALVQDGSYGQSPLLVRQDYPQLMGALVICEGGDKDRIKLLVTDAVRAITGISSESISVIQMNR